MAIEAGFSAERGKGGAIVSDAVCRACHVGCALKVEIADGKVVSIHGDKDNPAYHGYSCIKGRELGTYHALPTRLLHSQKRQLDGNFSPITVTSAIAEIAIRLGALIDANGPRSVALYTGTLGLIHVPTASFADAFMAAIGSPMAFTTLTIDQAGNVIASMLHGIWMAGTPDPDESDVVMFIGVNALVSLSGGLGPNPARQLKQGKKRGMKLIVIDPRASESARQADVHLQARPGEDPAILAGMIRILLSEGTYDREFVNEEAIHLDALRNAVEPFTPEHVAARAGVAQEDLLAAARLFANSPRGGIRVGTGANMSGHANLTCYLAQSLMTIAGMWRRAGDIVGNPGVLAQHGPWMAATPGPLPAWGLGDDMRVKGFTRTAAGLPTPALADEILASGADRIRALIVLGGNPMLAMPDQLKMFEAIGALELLVVLDPHMSETAKLADYVIAPKLPLEQEGLPAIYEMAGVSGMVGFGWGYSKPYMQYVEKLLDPPAGSDVIDDWAFFFGLAQAMGVSLRIPPALMMIPQTAAEIATPLDMTQLPEADDVWRMLTKGSAISFDMLKANAGAGRIYDLPETRVLPRPPQWAGRLDLGNPVMLAELAPFGARSEPAPHAAFPFRLLSRRLHDVHNSNWHEDPLLRRRVPTNAAYMHPDDLAELNLAGGELVEIRSPRAAIRARVEPEVALRRGCVSMAHCFGLNPDQPDDPDGSGANVGRLISVDEGYDPYTGIPRMSAIPVVITACEAP